MLTIQRFSPAHLEGLTELVNHHLGLLPVPWRTEPGELSACLWGSRWPHAEFWDNVADLSVECAVDRGRVVGAAQLCQRVHREERSGSPLSGVLNWLFFYPDQRGAAELLLDRAFRVLRHLDCRLIVAFDQCGGLRFANFTRGHLSSRWEHIDQALCARGFERTKASQHCLMAAPLTVELPVPTPRLAIRTRWLSGMDSEVRAVDAESGQQIGFCTTWDMARASADAEASAWEFVAYIEVAQGYRRRGVGAHLLTLQMQRAAKAGKKFIALAVTPTNTLALSLYRKLGFEARDEMRSYELVLSA